MGTGNTLKNYKKSLQKKARNTNGAADVQLKRVYTRDKGFCVWCDKWITLQEATREHMIPFHCRKMVNRINCDTNIRIACQPCNTARGPNFMTSMQDRLHTMYIKKLIETGEVVVLRNLNNADELKLIPVVMYRRYRSPLPAEKWEEINDLILVMA